MADTDTVSEAERKVEQWVADQMALAAAEATGEEESLSFEAGSDSSESKERQDSVTLKNWDKEFQVSK